MEGVSATDSTTAARVSVPRRADAERNRAKILDTARAAFAESDTPISMAEISRRAGVGMATLYRNFPGRRELLEALYVEEVDAVCAASHASDGDTPMARLETWLRRFVEFAANKHEIAVELLESTDRDDPVFDSSRARVLSAGRPLLAAALESEEAREDLSLEQILDMVIAVNAIRGAPTYKEPILQTILDGIRRPPEPKPRGQRRARG